jgi:hypothetical protein
MHDPGGEKWGDRSLSRQLRLQNLHISPPVRPPPHPLIIPGYIPGYQLLVEQRLHVRRRVKGRQEAQRPGTDG